MKYSLQSYITFKLRLNRRDSMVSQQTDLQLNPLILLGVSQLWHQCMNDVFACGHQLNQSSITIMLSWDFNPDLPYRCRHSDRYATIFIREHMENMYCNIFMCCRQLFDINIIVNKHPIRFFLCKLFIYKERFCCNFKRNCENKCFGSKISVGKLIDLLI